MNEIMRVNVGTYKMSATGYGVIAREIMELTMSCIKQVTE